MNKKPKANGKGAELERGNQTGQLQRVGRRAAAREYRAPSGSVAALPCSWKLQLSLHLWSTVAIQSRV